MNITIFTDLLPYPLNSGGAQAQFCFIDQLRFRHNITIAFTESGRSSIKAMRQLQKLWPEVSFECYSYKRQLCHWQFLRDKAIRAIKLRLIPTRTSFIVERALKPYGLYFHSSFVKWINEVTENSKADIIQADMFPMLPIAGFIKKDIPKVFVHHEIRFIRNERLLQGISMSDGQRQLYETITQMEIDNLNRYDKVVTLTDVDKHILKDKGVATEINVSPAAINTKPLHYKQGSGRIVMLGSYRHIPNKEGVEWFSENILPLLDKEARKSIDIVGNGWPQHFHDKYGYNLLGFVENLADALTGNVLVVPLLTGSGMRMKILESAAISVPIVTTTVGVEGLDFRDNVSCLIADTPQEMADAVMRLRASESLRCSMGKSAHNVFLQKYSVEALANIRESIYKQMA